MAMMWNFEVMSDECQVVGIYASVNYIQKQVDNQYIYNFIIASSLNYCFSQNCGFVMPRNFKISFLLQSLKESVLTEQQILSQQLQQEKLSLASEKSRLDTLARLHGTASPEVSKVIEVYTLQISGSQPVGAIRP